MPKRFLRVTRSLENLSSGEKRAGWADLVGLPSPSSFCNVHFFNYMVISSLAHANRWAFSILSDRRSEHCSSNHTLAYENVMTP
jgi:hypothetical protein